MADGASLAGNTAARNAHKSFLHGCALLGLEPVWLHPDAPSPLCSCPVSREALERALNERERDIVLLHVLWGFKHREIAEQLGLPLGTVTSKYKDAIAKLKKFLKEETE